MLLLGKLTLAIIGLRFFGAEGFFVGMLLGHLAIDRTKLCKVVENRLAIADDNIRILLPYRYYGFYNKIESKFWGIVWGFLLGGALYGFFGFLLLCLLGHFVFGMKDNYYSRKFCKKFDDFLDHHWAKILGAVIGFVCYSKIIVFCGVIIGFFVDYHRLENATLFPWKSWNPLHLWKYSRQAKHQAYIKATASLAAKVAKVDGVISDNEVRIFCQLFEIKDYESSFVAKSFEEAKNSSKSYEAYCNQLKKITENRLELKESIIDNLFQIAKADDEIKEKEIELISKIAIRIELPMGNFEVIKDLYLPKAKDRQAQKYYDVLGVKNNVTDEEIRAKWKELIVLHHPDRLQSLGATRREIEATTLKMAKINQAYQELIKIRGKR